MSRGREAGPGELRLRRRRGGCARGVWRMIGRGMLCLAALLPLAWAAAPGFAASDPGPADPPAREAMRTLYERWVELVRQRGSLSEEAFLVRADELTTELFALPALSETILGESWATLSAHDRGRFTAALRRSLRDVLLAHLSAGNASEAPRLVAEEETESVATLRYGVTLPEGSGALAVRARRSADDRWQVVEAEYEGASLVGHYRERVQKLIKDYSFPYMVARIGDDPYVVLEDFEAGPVGELPAGWSWRSRDADEHKPYRVREENGNRYLEATDEGESVILGKDVKWNLEEYPYVSFRWRVHSIPQGGDERYDEKVDSGAGIYIVYKKVLGLIPESVKYVWSSTLPVGSAVRREGTGKPWMVVAESGEEHLGEWRTYVFDLRDAYRKTFGGGPPDDVLGIGILSDANSTRSRAFADYDDIRALRTADPGVTGGVEKRLRPKR